jgi:hypothetical protein
MQNRHIMLEHNIEERIEDHALERVPDEEQKIG